MLIGQYFVMLSVIVYICWKKSLLSNPKEKKDSSEKLHCNFDISTTPIKKWSVKPN